jgi:hypothetical protein
MCDKGTIFTVQRFKSLLLERPPSQAAWVAACSATMHLRIGNADATVERCNAIRQLTKLLTHIESFGLNYCDVWQRRETIWVETDVVFFDDQIVRRVIPCVMIGRTMADLLVDLRFYFDPRPVPGIGEMFKLGSAPLAD